MEPEFEGDAEMIVKGTAGERIEAGQFVRIDRNTGTIRLAFPDTELGERCGFAAENIAVGDLIACDPSTSRWRVCEKGGQKKGQT